MKMLNRLSTSLKSLSSLPKGFIVVLVLVLHLAIGAYYAGTCFLGNMASAVPAYPAGGDGKAHFMLPGDHLEQFYRYALPSHNLERGKWLYDSGYQYNFSVSAPAFSEGLVFFPFSIVHLTVSKLTGDVFAYNLIALLSFPMVGGAMYWLVFYLTRSHPAALLSSLLLALLPHRTSFLFGEMAFGVDLVWPPLVVLFFEKAIRALSFRFMIIFGACLLLYTTSNFAALYLFALFSLPYFAIRVIQTAFKLKTWPEKLRAAVILFAVTLPSLLYLFAMSKLIGTSGLSSGQDYLETAGFSPAFINATAVWSGNEKTVYLGWALIALIFLIFIIGLSGYIRGAKEELIAADRSVFLLSGTLFAISYMFCFGANLDTAININVYRWYFDHIPGANCIRTPGRLMGTAGFFFALFFGYTIHLTIAWLENLRSSFKRLIWSATVVFAIAIVINYHYTNPIVVQLDTRNEAYEKIKGASGIVFAVPVRFEAPHYLNATYLYYAQKYDLKIFSGHSSMYPGEWDRIIGDFLPVNDGKFDKAMMERFRERGIKYVSVHATTFEPSATPIVLAKLKSSPYLQLLANANGIHVFEVDFNASGEQKIDPQQLIASVKPREEDFGKFQYIDGWYVREVYPNQRPFRWMRGNMSSGIVFSGNKTLASLEFAFMCPVEALSITVNGKQVPASITDLAGGWKQMKISLSSLKGNAYVINFNTPKIYKVPPDTRDFGCMIGDVSVQ